MSGCAMKRKHYDDKYSPEFVRSAKRQRMPAPIVFVSAKQRTRVRTLFEAKLKLAVSHANSSPHDDVNLPLKVKKEEYEKVALLFDEYLMLRAQSEQSTEFYTREARELMLRMTALKNHHLIVMLMKEELSPEKFHSLSPEEMATAKRR
jgi:hypothetical protein